MNQDSTAFRPAESAGRSAPELQDDLKLLDDPVDTIMCIIRDKLKIADIQDAHVLVQLKLAVDSDAVILSLMKSGFTNESIYKTIMLMKLDFMVQLARVSKLT